MDLRKHSSGGLKMTRVGDTQKKEYGRFVRAPFHIPFPARYSVLYLYFSAVTNEVFADAKVKLNLPTLPKAKLHLHIKLRFAT